VTIGRLGCSASFPYAWRFVCSCCNMAFLSLLSTVNLAAILPERPRPGVVRLCNATGARAVCCSLGTVAGRQTKTHVSKHRTLNASSLARRFCTAAHVNDRPNHSQIVWLQGAITIVRRPPQRLHPQHLHLERCSLPPISPPDWSSARRAFLVWTTTATRLRTRWVIYREESPGCAHY
jgi:hypothetical protein